MNTYNVFVECKPGNGYPRHAVAIEPGQAPTGDLKNMKMFKIDADTADEAVQMFWDTYTVTDIYLGRVWWSPLKQ